MWITVTENEKEEKLRKKLYTYIGETARSAKERGEEHVKDLEFHREKSHMLKHIVTHQPDCDPSTIDFRMEIVSSHKSAFERQIREAVLIDRNLGKFSMNSKIEYSRTIIPSIKVKMGNTTEEEDQDIKCEKSAVEKIRILRKSHRKRTKSHVNSTNCQTKRGLRD